MLTDLSGLDSMELDCATELTAVMDAFKATGVGTVVRIVPDPAKDIGFNILSIVHYRRGVRIATCQTAEEASGSGLPSILPTRKGEPVGAGGFASSPSTLNTPIGEVL